MRKIKNEELDRISLKDFKTSRKIPVILILDDIRSMNNVGSAFRTADAFAVEKIYLCGITARPPHREIHKTALGSTESVEWEYVEDISKLCSKLKETHEIIPIEQANQSTNLKIFSPDNSKYAFVFGNEVSGVKDSIIESAKTVIEIPQFGTKHSLNISVCIGIVLWDYFIKVH